MQWVELPICASSTKALKEASLLRKRGSHSTVRKTNCCNNRLAPVRSHGAGLRWPSFPYHPSAAWGLCGGGSHTAAECAPACHPEHSFPQAHSADLEYGSGWGCEIPKLAYINPLKPEISSLSLPWSWVGETSAQLVLWPFGIVSGFWECL